MPESIEEHNQYEGMAISLQGELISDWLTENELESTTENKMLWIEKYSAKYRELINANPQLLQEYKNDKESVKEKIKNWLHLEETIH